MSMNPNMNPAPSRTMVRRSKKRSRRKSLLKKWLITGILAAALIAAGVYYLTWHQTQMQYAQYPLRYEELIVAHAEAFDLEPWHVAAVIRCESSFRETATSNVGARGLMQLMPDTGAWIAGKFDEEDVYTDDSLYTPELNIKYGCWFLQWLMTRYDGDRTLVTAAYHAGHGTVDKWLADPEISPDGKTLPEIPYESTRLYVGRVLKACEKYQELYDFSGNDSGN